MTARPLNCALIGLGMVAETHVRALADLKETVRLCGVLARTEESAKRFGKKVAPILGESPHCYPSVQAIADDGALDFVIIATPPDARAELVDILSGASKNILMEKPVERTKAAALSIVEMCEQRDVMLGIVFQHRMRAASRAMSKLLAVGTLGDLGLVDVRVPWWRDQSYYNEPGRGTLARDGGGVLISQAIHTLDLMLSFTGPVREVQAMASTTALHAMETEDHVSAGLSFANGAVGSLVASTACFPGAAESITLHGSKASAVLEAGTVTLTHRNGETETFGETAATGGGADPMAFTHEWHRDVIADFAHGIVGNHAPMVTGREALAVHRLIDALVTSSAEKRMATLGPEGDAP